MMTLGENSPFFFEKKVFVYLFFSILPSTIFLLTHFFLSLHSLVYVIIAYIPFCPLCFPLHCIDKLSNPKMLSEIANVHSTSKMTWP